MSRRIIDLSVPLEKGVAADPPGFGPKLSYFDHKQTVAEVCRYFPGLTPEQLPDGEGWAIERIDLATHNGTHLDAPWHYAPMSEGRRARTIDELPLEWFYGPGVVLDMRHKGHGEAIGGRRVRFETRSGESAPARHSIRVVIRSRATMTCGHRSISRPSLLQHHYRILLCVNAR